MSFQSETFTTILQRMINRVVARTALNDLEKTSQFFHVLAACARGIEKCQHAMEDLLRDTDIDFARGAALDARAAVFGSNIVVRQAAVEATGSVVFTRTGTTGTLTIAIGTQVKAPASAGGEDLVYATTAIGTITAGNTDSAPVAIKAQAAGSKYNVAAGAITVFASKPPGVTSVTNSSAITNGADEETDDAFRARIKAYQASMTRATITSLEGALLGKTDSVSGKTIRYAGVYEDESLPGTTDIYIDDGAGTAATTGTRSGFAILTATGGEMDIYTPDKPIVPTAAYAFYCNGALIPAANYYFTAPSGHIRLKASAYPTGLTVGDAITGDYSYYTGLIAYAQKIIDGDSSDRANYPGYRAAGVLATVRPPTVIGMSVTGDVTVRQNYDQTTVLAAAENAVSCYINGLSIGEEVIVAAIIDAIMSVPGVYNVTLSEPATDTIIGATSLARITANQINLT